MERYCKDIIKVKTVCQDKHTDAQHNYLHYLLHVSLVDKKFNPSNCMRVLLGYPTIQYSWVTKHMCLSSYVPIKKRSPYSYTTPM